MFRTIMSNQF